MLALLDQGARQTTYKFAVLLGLIHLCIEHVDRKSLEALPVAAT